MTTLQASKELAANLNLLPANHPMKKWNGKVYGNVVYINGEKIEVVENFMDLYNKAQIISTDNTAFDLLLSDKNEELFQYVVSNI